MKKIISIILFIFLLTGCSVNYDLNIDLKSNVKESFEISVDKNKVTADDIDVMKSFNDDENNLYADRIKTSIKNNKQYFTGSADYNSIDDFSRFSMYNSLFDFQVNSTLNEAQQTISITNFGTLFSNSIFNTKIDKLKININIPFLVTDHNGKKTDDDTYTWIIDDASDSINLTFDQTLFPEKTKEFNFNLGEYAIAIGITGGILIIVVIIFYLRLKHLSKKNNRI